MHELYMQRCLELAQRGAGRTAPNPLVGCVLVHDGKIIGEGWHRFYGGPHAEVEALASVRDRALIAQATLYVNLEPCVHYGKTPPCVEAILEAGIRHVYVGTLDPCDLVCGRGVETLERSGCQVHTGLLAEACRNVNRRFFTFHEKKRPYVLLKWAESADGFIGRVGQRTSLSGSIAQVLMHRWRSEEAAILVGTNTARIDNPQLTVRHWPGPQPLRLVIDRKATLPRDLHLFDGTAPTWIFSELADEHEQQVQHVSVRFDDNLGKNILEELFRRKVLSVMIEGGKKLLQHFIDMGLWDEARIIRSRTPLGKGLPAPVLHGCPVQRFDLHTDEVFIYLNPL